VEEGKNVLDQAPSKWPAIWWWALVGLGCAILVVLPAFLPVYWLIDLSVIAIFSILVLSMSFLWGFGGMLSFGQTGFFGVAGYVYAVSALNFGTTYLSLTLAVASATVAAVILGYFVIYGRIQTIYFTIITLVFTLVLEKAFRATSGPLFTIGDVRLGGENGIAMVPSFSVPWQPGQAIGIEGVYYVAGVLLVMTYVGLRLVLTTKFGRILVAVRENEARAGLLGYDTRKYKLCAFTLCGALAGLGGVLYAIWDQFVAPQMMGLGSAASVVIYGIVGGKGTLIGPIVGTAVVQQLTLWLGEAGIGQVNVVLGAVLITFVMIFPRGLVPSLGLGIAALFRVQASIRGRWTGQRKGLIDRTLLKE
jgi:branched-chain amino acid transport system permease protein